MIKLKNLLNEDDFKSPNTQEHHILRTLKKELDSDYRSNFTLDHQTLMVSYNGRKVEIDVDRISNHDYHYTFTDNRNGQKYEVGDVVRVNGDDTDVNEVLRQIFSGQMRTSLGEDADQNNNGYPDATESNWHAPRDGFASLDQLKAAIDRIPDTVDSLKVQSSLSYFSPASIKITPGTPGWRDKAKRILDTTLAMDGGDEINVFKLNSHFGWRKDPADDSLYIQLISDKSKRFADDMGSGKYGKLD